MSEHNWVTSGNPEAMLFMVGVSSERKLRLFACAAARAFWSHLEGHQEFVEGIETAERYADGLADDEALLRALDRISVTHPRAVAYAHTRAALYACGSPDAGQLQHLTWQFCNHRLPPRGLTVSGLADLFRELFANPFRPPSLSSDVLAWQGGTVAQLAQAAYDERLLPAGTLDPARVAVLADALEDAGCAEESIVAHLREPGPHVRGCWVVDLILGKT